MSKRQHEPGRVLRVIDNLGVGGAERLEVTFAEEARRMGIPVTVVCLNADDDAIWQDLRERAADVRVLPRRSGGLHNLVGQTVRLARLARSLDATVVHTSLTYANIVGVCAAKLARVPVVATLHSAHLDRTRIPSSALRAEAVVLRRLADDVIAVGPTVARAHQGRLRRELRVVANAVEGGVTLTPERRAEIRREVTGAGNRPLIISVGRLEAEKGYFDLVDALAFVRARHPRAVLAIVGGGTLAEAIADHVSRLGLEGYVRLLGARSDVAELLAASDIYVGASHWEGLPLSVLEAMAAGLPVVATRVGDIPEVVPLAAGRLVEAHSPQDLAHALAGLLDAPERVEEMGQEAARWAADNFRPDRWMAKVLEVYDQVAPCDRVVTRPGVAP